MDKIWGEKKLFWGTHYQYNVVKFILRQLIFFQWQNYTILQCKTWKLTLIIDCKHIDIVIVWSYKWLSPDALQKEPLNNGGAVMLF